MDIIDIARVINSVLAAVAFLGLAVRLNDDWAALTSGWRTIFGAFMGFLTVLMIGSVEALLDADSGGSMIRVWWAMAFTLFLLLGLWRVRNDRRPDSGWIRATEVKAILDDVEAEEHEHHGFACIDPGCVKARARLRIKIEESTSLPHR